MVTPLDIWISRYVKSADKVLKTFNQFGFTSSDLNAELFTLEMSIVRMGVPPFKLEIITTMDGVEFEKCFEEKNLVKIDNVDVNLISLENLKINKVVSGRLKDLNDLENFP